MPTRFCDHHLSLVNESLQKCRFNEINLDELIAPSQNIDNLISKLKEYKSSKYLNRKKCNLKMRVKNNEKTIQK